MSKSSNALLSGIYRGLMRGAAPILFCTAILLLVGRFAVYANLYRLPLMDEDPSTTTNIYFFLESAMAAIGDSALVFAGSAIVWAVRNRAEGGTQ
jgi:hypothetical protein